MQLHGIVQPAHPASCSYSAEAAFMPRKAQQPNQKVVKAAAAEKPTQKQALAEALHYLGPHASHAALARFVKERFGMELTFCILVPKAGTARKPDEQSAPRSRCA
jgi:hypothetical protein